MWICFTVHKSYKRYHQHDQAKAILASAKPKDSGHNVSVFRQWDLLKAIAFLLFHVTDVSTELCKSLSCTVHAKENSHSLDFRIYPPSKNPRSTWWRSQIKLSDFIPSLPTTVKEYESAIGNCLKHVHTKWMDHQCYCNINYIAGEGLIPVRLRSSRISLHCALWIFWLADTVGFFVPVGKAHLWSALLIFFYL